MKQTVVELENVKEEDFSEVLSKDIFGKTSKDLEIPPRANRISTEIPVFVYTHTHTLYFCMLCVKNV